VRASLGDKLMDLSFSDLLTNLGLDPPSLVDLRGKMLVNSMDFRKESDWFFYLLGWWKP